MKTDLKRLLILSVVFLGITMPVSSYDYTKPIFEVEDGAVPAILHNITGFCMQSVDICGAIVKSLLNTGVIMTGVANKHPRLTLAALGGGLGCYLYHKYYRAKQGYAYGSAHCFNSYYSAPRY